MKRRAFLAGALAVPLAAQAQTPAIPARKLARLAIASSTFRANFDGWQHTVLTATPRLTLLTLPAYVRDTFGIRKLELWGSQFAPLGHTPEHYRAINAAARAAGVGIVNFQLEDLPSLNQPDPALRAQVLETLKGWMDKAKMMGAASMRINVTRQPGPIDLVSVVQTLRAAAQHGRSIGVRLLIENHGGYTQSIPKMIELVRLVDHPFCQITIDWGAWAPPGDRYEAMQSAMPYTHLVSAKGTVFDEATYVHTPFDIARLAKAAEAGGFRGDYSIELYTTPAPKDTDAAVWSHIRAITGAMA